MKKTMLVAIVVMFSAAGMAWAGAVSLTVPNFSFEDQNLDDATSAEFAQFGDPSRRMDGEPGWEASAGVDVVNPAGDGTGFFIPPLPDGDHVLIMESLDFTSIKASLFLPADLKEGFEYTVSVDIAAGDLDFWKQAGEGVVQVYAIPDLNLPVSTIDKVIDVDVVTPTEEWMTLEYSFIAEALHVGADLLIELADGDPAVCCSPTPWIHWDNLRVTEEAPMSMACDFDTSGTCDDVDIDLLAEAVRNGTSDAKFDVDGIGGDVPDDLDFDFYITDDSMLSTGFGDHDLNMLVNFNDFVRLSNNFGMTGTGWSQGNGNTDDVTNFNDFVRLSNNFGSSFVSDGNIVPEPAGIGLITLFVTCVFRRRCC